MLKYLFFDFDGVLLNSEPFYQKYWIEACKENGFNLSIEDELSLRSQDHELTRQFFLKTFGETADYDRIHASRKRLMDEYLKDHHFYLKDNVKEVLEYIKENTDLKIVIVSSSSEQYIQKHAGFNGIFEYFDEVISVRNVKRGKPFPDVYLSALERVHANKDEVIVFEDSPNGIRSAYNAGLKVIFIEDLSPYNEEIKNKTIAQLKNIKEIIGLHFLKMY